MQHKEFTGKGKISRYLWIWFAFVLLVACVPASDDPGDKPPGTDQGGDATPATPIPLAREERPVTKLPETVPTDAGADRSPVTGEVPDELLADIVADLAQREGVIIDDIAVIRGEAVVWNDGALGCPEPGALYTQALVPGYWVVLKVGESEFDYRASEKGRFLLCERGGAFPVRPRGDAGSGPAPQQ